MSIRTDLAIESAELYWETAETQDIPGVSCEEDGDEEIRITRVEVLNEEGEKIIGKKPGRYVTIEMPSLLESESSVQQKASRFLSQELSGMMESTKLTLVAGLGNSEITPDSLGPKVIPRLVVTRHLFSHLPQTVEHLAPVCALAPGVLGITGIETGEIIKGVAERVKPDLVIVVDALASRKTERVSTTIQIADTGISPGSGVGNKRKTINAETVGVPVIAIGVPMVVDAATIANDTIDLVIDTLSRNSQGEFFDMLQNIDREKKHALIRESLPKEMSDMMVTPKDIDALSERIAHVVANGINLALHKGISEEEIASFVS
ncbi:MAG: GPR endopeptidase [Ruminococcaceae bacterium]|nr:GPR endopeptidase [Oscillospiraceae bacterium]